MNLINFNLIVSTFRHREIDAQKELIEILNTLGDPAPDSYFTGVSGILLGRTNCDPLSVIEKLAQLLHNEPWKIRYILRLLPIDVVVRTEQNTIKHTANQLSSKIPKFHTFRVTVEKRHNSIRSLDIIRSIADTIDRNVNLENPDWIILVEIVGDLTGISILRPSDIFSSVIEKRKLSTIS